MTYLFILFQTFILNWTFEAAFCTTTRSTTSTAAQTTTTAAATSTITTASPTTTTNTSLACYDCTETFKRVWDPYTNCQYYPTRAPLRSCLEDETYCKVEQVSYREMTVSITRGCTDSCYHGCYAFGFGLTRVKCTSCCRAAGCNVGSVAATRYRLLDFIQTLGGCLCLSVSNYMFKNVHRLL